MTGAIFALSANIAIALLIAGTFAVLSRLRGAPGALRWFAGSYLIGALTPASELLVHLSPVATGLFAATSFGSFTLAFLVMAGALGRYYGVPVRPALLVACFVGAVGMRWAIWGIPRESPVFAGLYQVPFALATALCALVVARGARGPLDRLLAGLFGLAALHFLAKPAVAYLLGAGSNARDYMTSGYALFSQAASGLILVAVALALILVVVIDMTAIIHRTADQDGLSGLLNRRAFDREAQVIVSRRPVTAVMFDIDHFKAVNDTHGHAAGDRIIEAVAEVLRDRMPVDAVVGRTGGEEFSVLVAGHAPDDVQALADLVRRDIAGRGFTEAEIRFTLSGGVAVARPEEGLSALMARADRALYAAKSSGRNRVLRDRPGPEGPAAGRANCGTPA